MNERGNHYAINEKNIEIYNFLGLVELQKKYNIFNDFRLIEYIKYIKENLIKITSQNYFEIINDLKTRQESLFIDINLNEALNQAGIPDEWRGKSLNIYLRDQIFKSISI